jgi:hypothetical protein
MPRQQFIGDCLKCNEYPTVIRRSAWQQVDTNLNLTESSLCLSCSYLRRDTTCTRIASALTHARRKAGFNPKTQRFETKGYAEPPLSQILYK